MHSVNEGGNGGRGLQPGRSVAPERAEQPLREEPCESPDVGAAGERWWVLLMGMWLCGRCRCRCLSVAAFGVVGLVAQTSSLLQIAAVLRFGCMWNRNAPMRVQPTD